MSNNDSDTSIVQALGEVFAVEQGLQDSLIKIENYCMYTNYKVFSKQKKIFYIKIFFIPLPIVTKFNLVGVGKYTTLKKLSWTRRIMLKSWAT